MRKVKCECGWITESDIAIKTKCRKCGRPIDLSSPENRENATPSEYSQRQSICKDPKCHFYAPDVARCAFYMSNCALKQLWNDQIDPPEQCPRKEKFL